MCVCVCKLQCTLYSAQTERTDGRMRKRIEPLKKKIHFHGKKQSERFLNH